MKKPIPILMLFFLFQGAAEATACTQSEAEYYCWYVRPYTSLEVTGDLSKAEVSAQSFYYSPCIKNCCDIEVLRKRPGVVSYSFEITPSGSVKAGSIRISEDEVGSSKQDQCMIAFIQSWKFKKGRAATQVSNYSIQYAATTETVPELVPANQFDCSKMTSLE